MHVPDPPVEVGVGVEGEGDEGGSPPAFAGVEGINEAEEPDMEGEGEPGIEGEGDADEAEGAGGTEAPEPEPEPEPDDVPLPGPVKLATGGPGKT